MKTMAEILAGMGQGATICPQPMSGYPWKTLVALPGVVEQQNQEA